MRNALMAGAFAVALACSACATSTTPTTTTPTSTVNLASAQAAWQAIQPGLDNTATALLADNTVGFTAKEQLSDAQVAFDAAVKAFVAAPNTATNAAALASAVVSASNVLVPMLPALSQQQKTDVSLAQAVTQSVVPTAAPAATTAAPATASTGVLGIF
jgi:hypothetical protein